MRFKAATYSKATIVAVAVLIGCFGQPRGDALSTGSGARTNASASASIDMTNTRTVTIMDDVTNMPAFTLQVPKGWGFAGMIMRPRGCHPPYVPADALAFSAVAPDRVTAFEKISGVQWAWASDGTVPGRPGCAPIKINTAAGFLLNIAIPNLRPDARDITLIPATPQMQLGLENQRRQLQAQSNAASHQTIDAARVRLKYTLNKQPVEEVLFASITCLESDMPAYPMLHRAALQRHVCSTRGVYIRRAPQGQLDALIDAKAAPPQIDPAWDQFIQQRMRDQFAAWQQKNQEQFKSIQQHYQDVTNGMIKRGQQFQEQQRSSFENAMAQDRATQASIDHASQMQVRDSLNRQLFVDPNTGQKIETSNQYTHNWISGDGTEVFLNKDATADPNGVIDPVRESWTELIPIN